MMEAGRELDALVAEKVMGWTKRISADHTGSEIKVLRNMGIIYAWKDAERKERGLDVPAYSTDIAAAWQVAEMMRGLDFRLNKDGDWVCCFGGTVAFCGESDTAPHAICLAALKAVGVEI